MVVVFSMKKANVYFQKRVKDADIKDLNRRQILGLISDIQQENAEKTTMECFKKKKHFFFFLRPEERNWPVLRFPFIWD